MNLLQKINAVRKAIGYIQKDKSVSTGGGSYKAVTHDTVTGMVRPAMIEQGIICWPYLIESEMHPPIEGSKQWRYEATYDFTFVNIDDIQEHIVIRIQAHAMDNSDKAPGKALSYAKKYAMLKLFEIETGEDEESRYSEIEDKKLTEVEISGYIANIKNAEGKEEKTRAYKSAIQECSNRADIEAANKIKAAVKE